MKKIVILSFLLSMCFTVVSVTVFGEDIYNKDVHIIIEEITNDREDTVLFSLKEKLQGRPGVKTLTRNNEQMKIIQEEKNISSMNPTPDEEEIIKAAGYYIKGTLSEIEDIAQLRLNIVDLNESGEYLFRTIDYGYMRNGEFVKSFYFEDQIEDYLNEVIMYVRSPVKSYYKDNKLQLEITGESAIKENEEIMFRIVNDFNYLYIFTSTPEGELEYLDYTTAKGLLEMTAVTSIDGSEAKISEYLIVFGSQNSMPDDVFVNCNHVIELQRKVDNLLKDSQYAFTFVNYIISR